MISKFMRAGVWALLICVSWPAYADEEAWREYVRKAVEDPNVFVYNPPAELQAYAGLSSQELQEKQSAALDAGSILVLFPNGSPMRLESHKNSKPSGKFMTWYMDGALQSEESVVDGKLLQGKYFSPDGAVLAEVRDGRGKKIEFEPGEDSRTFVPSVETEYVDGLRDGKETTFSWKAGRVLRETHYRNDLKNGPSKEWAPNGLLTVQENYADGRKHGEAHFWHENGNLLATAAYEHGQQVGASSRYAKNGQKMEEIFREGKNLLLEMQWYPEGAMMVCKKYDPATNRLTEAQSFDRNGETNGTVQDARGKLVIREDLNGYTASQESFALEQYVGGNSPNLLELPTLQSNSALRDKDGLRLRFRVEKIPGLDELSARFEPLVPGTEPVTVQWKFTDKKAPSATLSIPDSSENWSGTVYAQCTVKGKAGAYSFTQIVYSGTPDPAPKVSAQPQTEKKARR